MSDWQPIETCPADGEMLVYGRLWLRWTDEGKDVADNWEPPDVYIAQRVQNGPLFVYAGDVTGNMSECRATHWMPKPNAPLLASCTAS